MLRGEVRWVDLAPTLGAEAAMRRPAVIVKTAVRTGYGVVTVVPVTSNTERVYPFQTLLPASGTGLPRDSKAQAEQVRSVAVERVGDAIGVLPGPLLHNLDAALRLHLDLG